MKNTSRSKLLLVLLLLISIEMVVGLRSRKLLLSPEVPLLKIRIVTAKQGMVSRRKILSLAQNKTLKIDTGSGFMPAKQGMVSKRRIPPSKSNPTQNKLKPRFSGSRNP